MPDEGGLPAGSRQHLGLPKPDLRPKSPSDKIGHSFPTLEEMPYIPTMPKNRIIPAITIAVLLSGSFQTHGQPNQPASTATGGPPIGTVTNPAKTEPPTDAERLLDEAITKVKAI